MTVDINDPSTWPTRHQRARAMQKTAEAKAWSGDIKGADELLRKAGKILAEDDAVEPPF